MRLLSYGSLLPFFLSFSRSRLTCSFILSSRVLFNSNSIYSRIFFLLYIYRRKMLEDGRQILFPLSLSLSLKKMESPKITRRDENLTIILAREFSISDSANPFYLKLGNSILGPPPRKNSLFHSRGCSTASPSSSPLFKERKHRFSSLSMLKVER